MAIIKCKMCGGDMEISADKTFGTCEYCGSTMTLPKVSDEQRAAAINRGNHFRRAGEFDKALGVYERIVAEDDTDAEAHWCCALCRFGIDYVEDPATYEWLPTCHRASFDSFLEDVDYLAALEQSAASIRRTRQKSRRCSAASSPPRRIPSRTTFSSATRSLTRTASAPVTACLRRRYIISSASRGGACSSRV